MSYKTENYEEPKMDFHKNFNIINDKSKTLENIITAILIKIKNEKN